jgi:uncharacterized ferritin-like protein (DUF455 family)
MFAAPPSTLPSSPAELRPRQLALQALQSCVPEQKVAQAGELFNLFATKNRANDDFSAHIPEPAGLPGRPDQPALFAHLKVQRRSLYTQDGLAALVHAVCHIEFNAINLALDAVWRFPHMPPEYYAQWARVAYEEAQHFTLLHTQLQKLGHGYGAFDAHNGLWDMTERTKHDITARMALVPRTLEARGLDATPPMQDKLRKVGTPEALETVAILDIILRDEIAHVAVGNHWYNWLCTQQGLDPIAHFKQLLQQHAAPKLRPPLNTEARKLAGFRDEELTLMLSAV